MDTKNDMDQFNEQPIEIDLPSPSGSHSDTNDGAMCSTTDGNVQNQDVPQLRVKRLSSIVDTIIEQVVNGHGAIEDEGVKREYADFKADVMEMGKEKEHESSNNSVTEHLDKLITEDPDKSVTENYGKLIIEDPDKRVTSSIGIESFDNDSIPVSVLKFMPNIKPLPSPRNSDKSDVVLDKTLSETQVPIEKPSAFIPPTTKSNNNITILNLPKKTIDDTKNVKKLVKDVSANTNSSDNEIKKKNYDLDNLKLAALNEIENIQKLIKIIPPNSSAGTTSTQNSSTQNRKVKLPILDASGGLKRYNLETVRTFVSTGTTGSTNLASKSTTLTDNRTGRVFDGQGANYKTVKVNLTHILPKTTCDQQNNEENSPRFIKTSSSSSDSVTSVEETEVTPSVNLADNSIYSNAIVVALRNLTNAKTCLIRTAVKAHRSKYMPPSWYNGHLYACEECQDTFISQDTLERHKDRRSILFTYSCPTCNVLYQFYNRCTFLAHVKIHNIPVRSFNLSICTIPTALLNISTFSVDNKATDLIADDNDDYVDENNLNELVLDNIHDELRSKNCNSGSEKSKNIRINKTRTIGIQINRDLDNDNNETDEFLKGLHLKSKHTEPANNEELKNIEPKKTQESSKKSISIQTKPEKSPINDNFESASNKNNQLMYTSSSINYDSDSTLKNTTTHLKSKDVMMENKIIKNPGKKQIIKKVVDDSVKEIKNQESSELKKIFTEPDLAETSSIKSDPKNYFQKLKSKNYGADESDSVDSDENSTSDDKNCKKFRTDVRKKTKKINSHSNTTDSENVNNEDTMKNNGKKQLKHVCRECKLEVTDLVKHYLGNGTPRMDLKCKTCYFLNPSLCALSAHMRIHNRKPPFICPDCAFLFFDLKKFYDHIAKDCFYTHKTVRYRCTICNAFKGSTSTFITHISKNHIKTLYKCNQCAVSTFGQKVIKIHTQRGHRNMKSTYLEGHACLFCPEVFIPDLALNTHLFKHASDFKFLKYVYFCPHCKSFTDTDRSKYAEHVSECGADSNQKQSEISGVTDNRNNSAKNDKSETWGIFSNMECNAEFSNAENSFMKESPEKLVNARKRSSLGQFKKSSTNIIRNKEIQKNYTTANEGISKYENLVTAKNSTTDNNLITKIADNKVKNSIVVLDKVIPKINDKKTSENGKLEISDNELLNNSEDLDAKIKNCIICHSNTISSDSKSAFCSNCVQCLDASNEDEDLKKISESRPKRKYKCKMCKELINREWITIRTHYEKNHQSDFNPPERNIFENVESKISKKRKFSSYSTTDNNTTVPIKLSKKSNEEKILSNGDNVKEKFENTNESSKRRPDNYICVKCCFITKFTEVFRSHIIVHKSSNEYQCLECGECFIARLTLEKHLLMLHGIKNVKEYFIENGMATRRDINQNGSEMVEENQCEICRIKCDSKQNYDKHIRIHGMAFVALHSRK